LAQKYELRAGLSGLIRSILVGIRFNPISSCEGDDSRSKITGGAEAGTNIVGECHAEAETRRPMTKACIPAPGCAFDVSLNARTTQPRIATATNSLKKTARLIPKVVAE
jgi:hypothetical protein